MHICNMQIVVDLCRLQQNTKRPRFKWCTAHKLDWAANFPNISKMKNRPKPIPNERGEGHYELINDHSGWNNVLSSHLCDCWQVDKVAKVDQEKSLFLAWRLSKMNWNSMQNYYGFKTTLSRLNTWQIWKRHVGTYKQRDPHVDKKGKNNSVCMGDLKFTKITVYNQSKGRTISRSSKYSVSQKEVDNKFFIAMLEDKILSAKWSKVAKIGPR